MYVCASPAAITTPRRSRVRCAHSTSLAVQDGAFKPRHDTPPVREKVTTTTVRHDSSTSREFAAREQGARRERQRARAQPRGRAAAGRLTASGPSQPSQPLPVRLALCCQSAPPLHRAAPAPSSLGRRAAPARSATRRPAARREVFNMMGARPAGEAAAPPTPRQRVAIIT